MSSVDLHYQHKDKEQQKFIDNFQSEAARCPGIANLVKKCPYLVRERTSCPFLKKVLPDVQEDTALSQERIFAP